MFLLGLTGDIACGKSTVARLLQERGAAHLDADALVYELYAEPDFARSLQAHLQSFQDDRVLDLLDEKGAIERRKLGELVFANATMLRHLETLVHPAVARLRAEKLNALKDRNPAPRIVVLEAVKLVESGQATGCDAVWWVTASRETQLHRLTHERGLSHDAARERLRNQPPREMKIAQLETLGVIWRFLQNDGSLEALRNEIDAAWRALKL